MGGGIREWEAYRVVQVPAQREGPRMDMERRGSRIDVGEWVYQRRRYG